MIKIFLVKIAGVRKNLDLTKIGRVLIYLNVFLLPLIIFSLNSNLLEFGKTIFFLSVSLLLALIAAIDIYRNRVIEFSYTGIDKLAGVFFLAYVLATIFSKDRMASFAGRGLDFNLSLVMIAALAVYYFCLKYFIKSLKQVQNIFRSVAVSSVILGLFETVNQIFTLNLPPINSSLLSLILLWFVLGFGAALALIQSVQGRERIIWCIIATLLLLVNFFFDFPLALIALLLFFALTRVTNNNRATVSLIGLMCLTTAALIMPIRQWLGFPSLFEISLPLVYGMQIGWSAIKESLLFGFGPHNFEQAFGLFRPLSINYDPLWSYSYSNADQLFFQLAATTGVLGVVSILALSLKAVIGGIKSVKNIVLDQPQKNLLSYLLVIYALIFIGYFFFSTNINLLTFNVLLLALLSSFVFPTEVKLYSLGVTIKSAILYGTIVLAFIAVYYLYPMKISIALAISYSSRQDAASSELISKFQKVIKYNKTDVQNYLTQAGLMMNDKIANPAGAVEQDGVDSLLETAMSLGAKNSNEAAAFRQTAQQYLETFGQDKYGIASWERRYIELAPNDPRGYFVRAGRLLSALQSLQKNNPEEFVKAAVADVYQKIENDLKKSLELKSDYAPALNAYGIFFVLKTDPLSAKKYFAQALNLNPKEKTYLLNFLSTLSTSEEKAAGLQLIERYLVDNPQDQDLLKIKEEFNKK